MFTAKRTFLAAVSILVLLALLVGCARPTPEVVEKTVVVKETVVVTKEVVVTPTPAGPRKGGTLIVGLAAGSRVVLELAESYEWIDDQTVEFKLKKGVKFHNGEDLTADDVVFTFERILTQDIGAKRRGFVKEVENVEKVDDYTVRFNLKSPWPVFMQMLVHNQIVPKDYLTQVGDEEFAKRPVGAGPFRFVEGKLDEQIVLERFDDYYGGADELPPVGPPLLDKVIFRMIPETSTRVASLLAGEVHIIQNVPAYMVPQFLGNPDVQVKTCMGTRPKFMDLNVTRPPFDDVRVRQALNYAVDAETLLAKVAGGYGIILPGPLSPANNYADPDLKPYGYDPEKAKELLAEAGYKPEDISFVIDAYGPYVEIAEAVAGQLRALGMDANVRTWEYKVVKPLLLNCERQAFLRDWGDSAFDPVGYIEAKWHTRVEGTPLGRGNFSCYSNPEVDALIEAGASEPDPEKRREIYYKMQRLIYEDAPAVFLYVPQEIEAASAKVNNWEPSPDSRINLHDVWLSE